MNLLYDRGRQSFLEGGIAWLTDNIKAILIDTGTYTPNFTTDQFRSDIPGGAQVSTSPNFTSKTSTAGVADADDITFTAVPATSVEAVVLFQDTGTAATSRLIAYLDSVTGLPATTNGGDVIIQWSNGPNKIFKL